MRENTARASLRLALIAAGFVALAAFAGLRRELAPSFAATPTRTSTPERASPKASSAPAVPARFLGSAACAGCHEAEHRAWQASDHRHALELPSRESVLGNFDNATFAYFGRVTRFTRDGSHYRVTTESQAGTPETFEIAYTLGRAPLQQYLVAFDDGRLQPLPFAWDTRPKEAGGQRWFHLYPDHDVKPTDPLFWTGPQQNFNHQCAECHTTRFDKNFTAATGRFDSHWLELGSGCESCHGPGSTHVDAERGEVARRAPARAALRLGDQTAELDQCGVCHARRTRLRETDGRERLHDTWRPLLASDGPYFIDGQIHDEVFEVGSFLQSKMSVRGVTCTNCHEPHTARLKQSGNALCTQCHDAPTFNTPSHHFHAEGTAGAACVSCHMPTRTYMVTDDRRDHRIAVPRPDLSDALGSPNACTACHAGKSNAWAADAIRQHHPARQQAISERPTLGNVLFQVQNERTEALASLKKLLADPDVSAFTKASAVAAVGERGLPGVTPLLEATLPSPDPWLRLGATQALRGLPPAARAPLLLARSTDDSRAVRLAAAPLLAGGVRSAPSDAKQSSIARLFGEYREQLALSVDRAEGLIERAGLERSEGNTAAARVSLETALERDPHPSSRT